VTVPTWPALGQYTPQAFDELIANSGASNVHLGRLLGQRFKSAMTSDSFYAARTSQIHSYLTPEIPGYLRFIEHRNRRIRDDRDLGLKILDNMRRFRGSEAEAIALAQPDMTRAAPLVMSAAMWSSTEASAAALELFQDAGKVQVRRHLKHMLEAYEQSRGTEAKIALLDNRDAQAFHLELETHLGPVLGTALDGLEPEKRQIVNRFYIKAIADEMKDGFQTLSTVQAVEQNAIARNQKNIKGLALTFVEFAEQTNGHLESIVSTQKQIKAELNTLNERTGKTEQGVMFMQQYMFSNMKPREQLAALQQGVFPDMKPAARRNLEDKISVVKRRADLDKRMASYLNGAAELVTLAGKLGVDSEIVGEADKMVNMGNVAFSAYQSFSSGNYLGAVNAIAGLFGGGGRDIAGERHEQVMKLLNKMYHKIDIVDQKINVIDQKIDALAEGQKVIVANQKLIVQELVGIVEQMEKNHREVIEELQEIHGDVLYNRALIGQRVEEEYGQCANITYHPREKRRLINTAAHIYPSVEDFEYLSRNFPSAISACLTRIDKIVDSGKDFLKNPFWLESYKTTTNGIGGFLEKVHTPSLSLLRNETLLANENNAALLEVAIGSVENRLGSLLAPMHDVARLDVKLAAPIEGWEQRFPKADPFLNPLSELIENALSPEAIQMHVGYVLDLHVYDQLLTPSFELYSLNELVTEKTVRESGAVRLDRALSLVDVAIAQQTLQAGDILLPVLREIFSNYVEIKQLPAKFRPGTLTALYDEAVQLLNNNALLARNFVLYKLRHEITKHNFLNYAVALGSTDAILLGRLTEYHVGESTLDDGWTFKWCSAEDPEDEVCQTKAPAGWSARIGNRYYALPSADELEKGQFQYHPELRMLLNLRSRLVEEISTYDLYKGLNMQNRQSLTIIILSSV